MKKLEFYFTKVTTPLELQSETQEVLDALSSSVLRPQGGAFKGEL